MKACIEKIDLKAETVVTGLATIGNLLPLFMTGSLKFRHSIIQRGTIPAEIL
jgi:hypothetical protein